MIRKIIHKYLWRILGINTIIEYQSLILNNQNIIKNNIDEIFSAHLLNSTISDSSWLKYKNFSPGRWAVDYTFLYTLYRILNSMKPKSIVEFGLGQSSKMLHQYSYFYSEVHAVTYEHDLDWSSFFLSSLEQNYPINIQHVDIKNISYKDKKTTTYDMTGLNSKNKKFDLIVVDGPYGSEHFSRPQIIEMLPDHISTSYCIILDDTHRKGELETISEIYEILDRNLIKYSSAQYGSSKKHTVICSDDLKFLLSL